MLTISITSHFQFSEANVIIRLIQLMFHGFEEVIEEKFIMIDERNL